MILQSSEACSEIRCFCSSVSLILNDVVGGFSGSCGGVGGGVEAFFGLWNLV